LELLCHGRPTLFGDRTGNNDKEEIRALRAEAEAAHEAAPADKKAAFAEEISIYDEMLNSNGEIYGAAGTTLYPDDPNFTEIIDLVPANYDPDREARAKLQAADKLAAHENNPFLQREILTTGRAFRMFAESHIIGEIAYGFADEFEGQTLYYYDENGDVKGTSRREGWSLTWEHEGDVDEEEFELELERELRAQVAGESDGGGLRGEVSPVEKAKQKVVARPLAKRAGTRLRMRRLRSTRRACSATISSRNQTKRPQIKRHW
jgi:hypothetical protein